MDFGAWALRLQTSHGSFFPSVQHLLVMGSLVHSLNAGLRRGRGGVSKILFCLGSICPSGLSLGATSSRKSCLTSSAEGSQKPSAFVSEFLACHGCSIHAS